MNLDHRARDASSSLHGQVRTGLDLDAAHISVLRGSARRRRRQRVAVTASVVVMVATMGVLVGHAGRDGGDVSTGPEEELSAADAAVVDGLPRSAIDGRDSWRLPVVVQPQNELSDGDTVTVYGRGFRAHESVGLVMCTSEAEVEGVEACDLGTDSDMYGHATSAAATSEGSVVADVLVRRFITTPRTGRVDCRSRAERCLIGVGAVSDYDRSGGSYINFAGAPDFPDPVLTVEPRGPFVPGAKATARATGLLPDRLTRVNQCVGTRCAVLAQGHVAADGTFTNVVTLSSVIQVGGEVISCEDHCELRIVGVGVEGATAAPFPEPVPLAFLPGAAPPVPPPADVAPSRPEVIPSRPETTVPPGSPPPPSLPGQTAPPSGSLVVPDVVAMDLQLAQDTLQAAGFYLLISHDATDGRRLQLWDRNWRVCDQQPAPGSFASATDVIDLGAVKDGEICP